MKKFEVWVMYHGYEKFEVDAEDSRDAETIVISKVSEGHISPKTIEIDTVEEIT